MQQKRLNPQIANSFSFAVSQKAARARVSRGANIKIFLKQQFAIDFVAFFHSINLLQNGLERTPPIARSHSRETSPPRPHLSADTRARDFDHSTPAQPPQRKIRRERVIITV